MQISKRFLVAICAQLLLLFAGVHSVSLSTYEDDKAFSDGATDLLKDAEEQVFLEDAEEPAYLEDAEEPVFLEDAEEPVFLEDAEEPEPTQAYLDEIREQVGAPRAQEEEKPLARDTRSTCRYSTINQGNNVAFQSYNRAYWLSCFRNPCRSRYTCPGFAISGSEWRSCAGEVFRFYRARGRGAVRVGDVVGVYYPKQPGKWLGCPHGNCGKYTCPGRPSNTYGFLNGEKWTLCGGEVFVIYAQGKRVGSVIKDHDIIMLHYLIGNQWVDLANAVSARRGGPGTTRPPSPRTYERHSTYSMEVWKQ